MHVVVLVDALIEQTRRLTRWHGRDGKATQQCGVRTDIGWGKEAYIDDMH